MFFHHVNAGNDNTIVGKYFNYFASFTIIFSSNNMVKKHQKPNPQLQQPGGIVEKEAGIQVSNVAIWNPKTEKADRVGFKVEGETKVRVFKSTGEVIA